MVQSFQLDWQWKIDSSSCRRIVIDAEIEQKNATFCFICQYYVKYFAYFPYCLLFWVIFKPPSSEPIIIIESKQIECLLKNLLDVFMWWNLHYLSLDDAILLLIPSLVSVDLQNGVMTYFYEVLHYSDSSSFVLRL